MKNIIETFRKKLEMGHKLNQIHKMTHTFIKCVKSDLKYVQDMLLEEQIDA